jgi:hypothetical protein
VGQQSQYCENEYTTESNLCVQCSLYQHSNDILHQNRKGNHKVHVDVQKTLNNQSNPDPKEKQMLEV